VSSVPYRSQMKKTYRVYSSLCYGEDCLHRMCVVEAELEKAMREERSVDIFEVYMGCVDMKVSQYS
jgi:hypothetical protein